jgi:hypothetical protein
LTAPARTFALAVYSRSFNLIAGARSFLLTAKDR